MESVGSHGDRDHARRRLWRLRWGRQHGPAKDTDQITLITKATGGFWDAMIAGAKKYATDNRPRSS